MTTYESDDKIVKAYKADCEYLCESYGDHTDDLELALDQLYSWYAEQYPNVF